MNDNPQKVYIALTVKDEFNGQTVKIHITEEVWDALVKQVETSRREKRKQQGIRLDA